MQNLSPTDKYQATIKLLDALSQGIGLQKIIELGYSILGNPLSVCDTSYKNLAIAGALTNGDPVWDEFVTQGYLSPESVHYYLSAEKLTAKLDHSNYPFYWTDRYVKYRRIMGVIRIGKRAVAGIGVIEQNYPFSEDDLELTSLLCTIISAELQKKKFTQHSRGYVYESFIEDLLDKKITNSKIVSERAQYLNLGLKKNMQILTIDINEFDNEHYSLDYVRNLLESMIFNCKAIVYNNNIVLIISSDKALTTNTEEFTLFKEFLHKFKMRGALSRSFLKLEELSHYYAQSLDALRIGSHLDPEENLYTYNDYAIYHIADVCAQTVELKHLCHPSLAILMEHDSHNGTCFAQTLYAYLKNGRNISQAAEELHFHRNTMIYRLERATHIMQIDLADNDTLLHLDLSFKLLQYDEKFSATGDGPPQS